jgi:hypothetical protein
MTVDTGRDRELVLTRLIHARAKSCSGPGRAILPARAIGRWPIARHPKRWVSTKVGLGTQQLEAVVAKL